MDSVTKLFKSKKEALALLREDQGRLNELQQVLWAQGKHAVLMVLQATDTGGKDGTIRHVLGALRLQSSSASRCGIVCPRGNDHRRYQVAALGARRDSGTLSGMSKEHVSKLFSEKGGDYAS